MGFIYIVLTAPPIYRTYFTQSLHTHTVDCVSLSTFYLHDCFFWICIVLTNAIRHEPDWTNERIKTGAKNKLRTIIITIADWKVYDDGLRRYRPARKSFSEVRYIKVYRANVYANKWTFNNIRTVFFDVCPRIQWK